MPNWCSNTLRVTTDNPEKLKEFYNAVFVENEEQPQWPKFTLDKLLPTPQELLDVPAFGGKDSEKLNELYGSSDWYQWRVTNWGTKWDVTEAFIEDQDDVELVVVFDSAWAPPVPWLEKIAPKFPELRFGLLYEEPGCDFCGYVIIEDGEVVDNEETSYQFFEEGTDTELEYNRELEKWVYIGTENPVSDDPDYWPESRNPFHDRIHI